MGKGDGETCRNGKTPKGGEMTTIKEKVDWIGRLIKDGTGDMKKGEFHTMLREIKDFLEHQPQPNGESIDELVKKISYEIQGCIGRDRCGDIEIDDDEIEDIIRSLLQSRQPVVTREEIYDLLHELHDMYGLNCIDSIAFEIMEFLKYKSMKVREKP